MRRVCRRCGERKGVKECVDCGEGICAPCAPRGCCIGPPARLACVRCDGRGAIPEPGPCPECAGIGVRPEAPPDGASARRNAEREPGSGRLVDGLPVYVVCADCEGAGRIDWSDCPDCAGEGIQLDVFQGARS